MLLSCASQHTYVESIFCCFSFAGFTLFTGQGDFSPDIYSEANRTYSTLPYHPFDPVCSPLQHDHKAFKTLHSGLPLCCPLFPSLSILKAVAPIVGRADLLCGFFAVIALSLTVGGGFPPTTSNKPKGCACVVKPEASSHDQHTKGRKRSSCRTRNKRGKRGKQSGVAGAGEKSTGKLGVVHDSIRQGIAVARQDVTVSPVRVAPIAIKGITKADNGLACRSGTSSTASVCSVYATRGANDGDQSRPKTAADAPAGTHGARASKPEGTPQTSTAGGNGKESTAAASTPEGLSAALEPMSEVAPFVPSVPDASSALAAELNTSNTPSSAIALGALPGPKEMGVTVPGGGVAASATVAAAITPCMSCDGLLVTENLGFAGEDVASYSGPGIPRFIVALGFACAATLCKEIGVTVFGLMAGADLVRFLDKSNCCQSRAKSAAGDEVSGEYMRPEENAKY